MLQQALVSPTAKLDISKLLKSSPSPSPPPRSTASIPSFSRSFSGPSVEADPRAGESATTSPTSRFPPLAFDTVYLNAQRQTVAGPPTPLSIPASSIKRTASISPQESRHASKKPTRQWSDVDSEKLVRLRGSGMKWDEIARHFPGRTNTACRLRYQNYMEKKYDWNDEKKKTLAVLYERRKEEMWTQIGQDLNIPWRAVEDMHWVIGQEDMASLGGGRLLHPESGGGKQSQGSSRMTSVIPSPIGPPSLQAHFVSAPISSFSRHPSESGAMLGQAPPVATTNGVAQPRYAPGGEDTGFGFHRTYRRQPSAGGLLPSLAELERGIPAYAAQGPGRYREEEEEEEEEVETKEEMEEETGVRQR
ncbi:MAG: hypothetical protein Q9226_004301 [Calogaya cf. arnoldii]